MDQNLKVDREQSFRAACPYPFNKYLRTWAKAILLM
ncbi:MAG: hypothetical protein H6Q43_3841, partial [Deltaproteobacteria bacterium]|nr:hypothetical protein [Deltaproteobacteria bacterium]